MSWSWWHLLWIVPLCVAWWIWFLALCRDLFDWPE